MNNIDWFLGSLSRLWGYFFFFDILIDKAKNQNKNKNVKLNLNGIPSLAVPGFYTTENGIKLFKFFEQLKSIELVNNKRKIFSHISGKLNSYEIRLKNFMDFSNEFISKSAMFTCSGGDSNFQLDINNNIHICHRTLFYELKEFVDALIKNEYIHGREESISKGMINNVKKNWIVSNKNQDEINRFLYITGNYHNHYFDKIHFTLPIIYELAYSNQISKIFLNETIASWFALFCHSALSCPAENLLNSGSIYLPPISLFRLFGNGAFEFIFKNLINDENK
jgi:hypothetical protein